MKCFGVSLTKRYAHHLCAEDGHAAAGGAGMCAWAGGRPGPGREDPTVPGGQSPQTEVEVWRGSSGLSQIFVPAGTVILKPTREETGAATTAWKQENKM